MKRAIDEQIQAYEEEIKRIQDAKKALLLKKQNEVSALFNKKRDIFNEINLKALLELKGETVNKVKLNEKTLKRYFTIFVNEAIYSKSFLEGLKDDKTK